MKKRVELLLVVFIIILLPCVLSATSEKKIDEINKLKYRIAYYAENYDSLNTDYLNTILNVQEAADDLDLAISDLDSEELKLVFGEATQTTNWVNEEGTQEQVDQAVSVWQEAMIYDGGLSIQADVIPVMSEGEISYNVDVSVDLANTPVVTPEVMTTSMSSIEDLVKKSKLDPDNLQTQNTVALAASNLKNAFEAYHEQSALTCVNYFTEVFGAENIVSEQMTVSKTYTLFNDGDIITTVTMTYCEKCEGYYWITLEFEFTNQEGKVINYVLIQETSPSLYENFEDDNEFKREIIDSMNTLMELIEAKSYSAANTVARKIEVINEVWNEKANEDPSKAPERFLVRIDFYESLFKEYPETTSVSEETVFSITLAETFEEGGEEICDNKIDDNNNEKIDCEDALCAGEFCGINTIDENGTLKTEELYCVKGTCQPIEPKTTKNTTCGNGKCEEGEIETCIDDCRNCLEYPPLECLGDVIFSGEDENGCALEPTCIERSEACSSDTECEQPLCGKAQCIEGECRVTELEQCTQAECIDGEEREQTCTDGKKITTEICSNKKWVKTGEECSDPSPEPIKIKKQSGQSCESKQDCALDLVCSNSICTQIPINKKGRQEASTTISQSGVTFTGNIIDITGDSALTGGGLTGVSREAHEDVLQPPTDYERETDGATGTSPLTIALSPTISEEKRLQEIERPIKEKPTIELVDGQTGAFVITCACVNAGGEERASMSFAGAGEDFFSQLDSLVGSYDAINPEWCKEELRLALQEREEIEKGFNEKWVKDFFESKIANNAEDWEKYTGEIKMIFNRIVENQKIIAEKMDCAAIEKLTNYNPIKINYQGSYGGLQYEENLQKVRFGNMIRDVYILTPRMEIVIFPTKSFVEQELIKAMQTHAFPGSSKESAERKEGNGLTANERKALKENTGLVKKIQDLSNRYVDGLFDVQISVIDEEKTIYNLYGQLGGEKLVRAEPMLLETMPKVDGKATIEFNPTYELIRKSEESYMKKSEFRAPWDTSTGALDIIKSLINFIETEILRRRMMDSIKITPENPELKNILEEMFYLIVEEEPKEKIEPKEVTYYTSTGKKMIV